MRYNVIITLVLVLFMSLTALQSAQGQQPTQDETNVGNTGPGTAMDEDALREMKTLLERGHTGMVLERLQVFVNMHPDNADAWSLLGFAALQGADELLSMNEDPSNAYQDGARAFISYLNLNPGDADHVDALLGTLWRLGRFDAAEEVALREAGRSIILTGLVPSWLAAWIAEVHVRPLLNTPFDELDNVTMRLDRALAVLDNTAKLAPEDVSIAIRRADLLQHAGLCGLGADSLFTRLLALPSEWELHQRLTDLHFYGGSEQRLPGLYAALLDAAPGNATVLWYAGYADLLQGDWARRELRLDDAEAAYRHAQERLGLAAALRLEFTETSQRIAFLAELGLGWCALRRGDLDRSAEVFHEALVTSPDLREMTDGLGRTLVDAVGRVEAEIVSKGRFALGLPLARLLTEVEPDKAEWFNNLGYMLREHASKILAGRVSAEGDRIAAAMQVYEESWQAYSRAVKLNPGEPRIVNDAALIQIYHLRNELPRARELLEQSIAAGEALLAEMGTDAPETERFPAAQAIGDAWQNMGYMAFHIDGNREKAIECNRRSVASNSGPRPGVRALIRQLEAGENPPDPYAVGAVGGGAAAAQQQPAAMRAQIPWESSFDEAMRRAEHENRPVLVYYRPVGLAEEVIFLDRVVTAPSFVRAAEGLVPVICDSQRSTFGDRRQDGRRVLSLRYGVVTDGEHIRAEREFRAFWPKIRKKDEPDPAPENFYYLLPDGTRFEPSSDVHTFDELFEQLREKSGEPRPEIDLDLLESQLRGIFVPQRVAAVERLLDAPGRAARDRTESLIFDAALPRAARAALVRGVVQRAMESRNPWRFVNLLEAMVFQEVDVELALLAIEAWPAKQGSVALLHALNWTDDPQVKEAAVKTLSKVLPEGNEAAVLQAWEAAHSQ